MEGGIGQTRQSPKHKGTLKKLLLTLPLIIGLGACGTEAPPIGNAIANRDSIPVMVVNGVSKLISDSGVIRYKLIAEEWYMYDRAKPPRQDFKKGIFVMRLDEKFDVDLFISADTAYCYDQNLWELRGRVRINDLTKQTKFSTEELFWDMRRHEMYSNQYMHIVTPDRDLEGNSFVSNEKLTRYTINWARGNMPLKRDPLANNGTSNSNSDSLTNDDSSTSKRKAPNAQRKNY